jgi:ribonuclease-3
MNPNNLESLQQAIGYTFKDQDTLIMALTHRSSLNDPNIKDCYERLEFLGDAILEMLISSFLYFKYPDKMEGYLTAARSAIVRTETLSQIAKSLNLGSYLRLSKGEESTGGRNNPSTLEDVTESIIGAIYQDGGLEAAKVFFDTFIVPEANLIVSENKLKDAKSSLQEIVQAKGLTTPLYQIIKEIGPDHDKTFETAVIIDSKQIATGIGKSKQEAEQKAAQKALELI